MENQNCLNLLNQLSGSTNTNDTILEVFSALDQDNDGLVSKVEVYSAKTEDRDDPWRYTCKEFGKTQKNCWQCTQYDDCEKYSKMKGGRFVLCNCKTKKCEGHKPDHNSFGALIGYVHHNTCQANPCGPTAQYHCE